MPITARDVKIIVDFFLFGLAAVLGGIISIRISKENLSGIGLFITFIVVIFFVVSLFIFRDWYETPKRVGRNFQSINTHTNTKLILDDLKEIKERLKRK